MRSIAVSVSAAKPETEGASGGSAGERELRRRRERCHSGGAEENRGGREEGEFARVTLQVEPGVDPVGAADVLTPVELEDAVPVLECRKGREHGEHFRDMFVGCRMVVLRDGEGFAGNAPDGQVAQRGRLLRVVGQRQVVHIPHCGVEALLSAVDDEDGIVAAVGEDGMLPVGVVVDDVKAVSRISPASPP